MRLDGGELTVDVSERSRGAADWNRSAVSAASSPVTRARAPRPEQPGPSHTLRHDEPAEIKRALAEPSAGSTPCPRTCSPSSSGASPKSGSEGIDVISLGIGDPDRPTYPHIVEAMQTAVADPANHSYPSNRGRAELRRALRDFYERALRGRDRRRVRGDPGDRSQGVHLQPLLRLPRPRRRRARGGSRLPRVHRRARRSPEPRRCCCRFAPELGLRARPGRDPDAMLWPVPACCSSTTRTTRPAPWSRTASSSALVELARAQRDPGRPRQRLLGDDLRRIRRPELPRHPRREGGRSGGLLALEGLQHDRLALRRRSSATPRRSRPTGA